MGRLEQIQAPIQEEMKDFERRFRRSMKSSVPLLDTVTQYIVRRKGKQVRPMFVFLSACVSGGISEETYRAAMLVELMHTATLVHDDVVDDSNERRGFFSLNALWKNKIAVLIGDYLLSKSLLLSTQNGDFKSLEIISEAVRLMSEGELLQIEKARRLDIKEDVYYDIIRGKTASLIAACCAAGAHTAGADAAWVEHMRLFGEYTGMAFQIKDDLFDFQQSSSIGKPTGIDIKEQKMTLPLIYALENSSWATKRSIIRKIRRHHEHPDKVQEVVRFVLESGGMEYAEQQMLRFRGQALDLLDKAPELPARESLRDLVLYTTERKK